MSDETREALAITIRELGKENEKLQQRISQLMRKPKDARTTSACLGFTFKGKQMGGNLWYQSQPQITFKPERFCVSKVCAPYFLIRDIRVGMISQLISPEPLPANLFAVENIHRLRELSIEEDFDAAIPMTFDIVNVGLFVTIDVEPIEPAPDDAFECVMIGEVLNIERGDFPKGPLTLTSSKKEN